MSADIRRLEMDELREDLAEALRPRVERLGYLGEFFKCVGCQPDALLSFMAFTDDLKKALPDNLTEVVSLTVAGVMGNDYERNQHERLCARLGFAREWIREVNALAAAQGGRLSEPERLAQALTLAAIERRGKSVGPELQALIDAIGAEQSVAVLMLIGRYVTHALIVNGLDLAPPAPSIFDEEPA